MMIVAKLFAFWIALAVLNVSWTLNFDDSSFFSIYPVVSSTDIIGITTVTDAIFIMIMTVALSIYVVLAVYFHNTHIHPRIVAQLAKFDLLHLVTNNFKLYHEISMWLLFTWIANFLVLINSVGGRTLFGVPTFSILFTAFLTVVFLKDTGREIESENLNKSK